MDRSPATIARLLTCVKEDLINLKAYFERWDARLRLHPQEKAICIDHRDIDIEVKTLLSQFQRSLRDLLNTLPEWKDVETITMAQQVNQLTVGEMMSLKEATTASNSTTRKPGGGGGGGGAQGRDDLYKCINQLACKIAERSLPLFMGEAGSPLMTPKAQKKSPTEDSPGRTARSSPSDEESQNLPEDTTTPKQRNSPSGSGSLHSSEPNLSSSLRLSGDSGPTQDQLLSLRDKNAVDFIFNRAKNFAKYIADFVKNEEKRITGEVEHARALCKNYQGMVTALQPNQTTQSNLYMPLQANLISHSKQFSERCREFESRNFAQCWDELEHLKKRNGAFDNQRRALKESWKEQMKKMTESRTQHDKLRTNYISRCQAVEKVRAEEADVSAQLLASQGENFGSSSEVDGAGASSSPGASLTSVGPGGVAYGPLAMSAAMHSPAGGSADLVGSGPTKLKNKVDKVQRQKVEAEHRQREAEEDYRQAVHRLNETLQETEEQRLHVLARVRDLSEELERVFKQTNLVIKKNELDVQQKVSRLLEHHIEEMETYTVGSMYSQAIDVYIRPRKDEFHVQQVSFEPYSFGLDSHPERQRAGTPRTTSHRSPPASGGQDELDMSGTPTSDRVSGRSSLYGSTDPELDGTVGSVKTTLNEWASNIKNKFSIKSRRAPAGELGEGAVSVEAEVKHARYILSRCIAEIEERGLKQIGLYRCSASVKSTMNVMDNLQAETPGIVDLSEESIFTLCGVIKFALKNLSEPLTTYECYGDFLDIGKEAISSPPPAEDPMVRRLVKICATLPEANKMTCGILFHHLKKVADHSADNQMTAANLGTCLSPTLLKPKSVRAAAKADVGDMMDNPPRSRVIELLIAHVEEVFGPRQEYIMDLDFSSGSPSHESCEPKARPSAIAAPPQDEVPPAPGSAPPLATTDPSVSVEHPPAVRSSSDSVVRAAGDVTDSQPPSRPHPFATVLPKTATVSMMMPPPVVPGREPKRTVRPTSTEPEPGEIAFIDTDSTEDLSHSTDLSLSASQHSKTNFKKTVKNLFRKRKTEQHLVGRSLEQLPHLAPPRPVERVASLHLLPDNKPHLLHSNGTARRVSVTRLGRTEGDGHSTPTSPVASRRSMPPPPPPQISPRTAIRRRLSDADDRKAEARAVVRDRHRAAARDRPVQRRDHSAPADRARLRPLSTPVLGHNAAHTLPPRIRSPLEPRRAADARNRTSEDHREFRPRKTNCRQPPSSSSSSPGDSPPLPLSARSAYGSLTPRRSHPEFV